MQRIPLIDVKPRPNLCCDDGIVVHAISAFLLFPRVPEIGASTGVGAFAGEAFGAVLDLYVAMPAEVVGVQYPAHC